MYRGLEAVTVSPSSIDLALSRAFCFFREMKSLVQHLMLNNSDEIISKSLLNCHCLGLHSIMLLDSPGKTIRLYVADETHELWRNDRVGFLDGSATLGFHAHHCNITLHSICGTIVNDMIVKSDSGKYTFDKFIYQSAIIHGQGGFKKVGEQLFAAGDANYISKGQSVALSASDIYTVWAKKGEIAAWFVYEGEEDDNYEPYTYSSANLEAQSFSGLYQKPTIHNIETLLSKVDLI